MKKIALYTIQSINYGNRLQNYATQEILKSMGYDVYTLRNNPKNSEIAVIIKLHPFMKLVKPILPLVWKIKVIIWGFMKIDKDNNYRLFNKKIKFSADYIGENGVSDDLGKYDVIIAGSDQIWNTEFEFVTENSFFPFEHPCKVSFSSSFGIDEIKDDKKIVECLKKFKALSVREEAGAKIIKKLTGRDAEVLIDPTLLLSEKKWRMISKKPKGHVDMPFILTYFLSPKCKEANEQLSRLAESGMNIYELFDEKNVVTRCVGPAEFIYLIDHASIILTDSFHACVFSFLFDKPFIVYNRNRGGNTMNSRLSTLLKKFKIERKYVMSELDNDIWEHDYTEGYEQLEIEKAKALNFLKSALEDGVKN
ncbi:MULTISPECIES: polysaccharide pyruvyl transferase family protein [Clostridia]|uniref:polysaccharide pyruvyl transferase family protein n=1 Tax=Clostridia TaxID=186801 RepID=UPI000E522A9D|nr:MULTISPECIES: polysaccharide pyruvyl transferase family protein [Clostridia]RHV70458.1 polysaccharide pyruvyl transferase family protein [Roseburia sp. OM02-15]